MLKIIISPKPTCSCNRLATLHPIQIRNGHGSTYVENIGSTQSEGSSGQSLWQHRQASGIGSMGSVDSEDSKDSEGCEGSRASTEEKTKHYPNRSIQNNRPGTNKTTYI